jgi:hypothetical protein
VFAVEGGGESEGEEERGGGEEERGEGKNSACFELCSCRLESIVVAVIQKLYLGVSSETLSCPLLCCYSTHLTTERTADAAVITASGRYRSNFPTTAM